jgi:hydrogenase maturation factor HypF (carbamoyltransferase family)
MSLSDACFEFLQANAKAAEELAAAVHHYAAPGYPITYGIEIDALRQACLTVRERPYDAEAGAELLRLAASVMTFHDAAPFEPERIRREAEMNKLIRKLLEEPLQADDKAAVAATIQNVVVESPFTPAAAERLKIILSKVGASAYETAVKIISDIGSATVKKMLGL